MYSYPINDDPIYPTGLSESLFPGSHSHPPESLAFDPENPLLGPLGHQFDGCGRYLRRRRRHKFLIPSSDRRRRRISLAVSTFKRHLDYYYAPAGRRDRTRMRGYAKIDEAGFGAMNRVANTTREDGREPTHACV